MPTIVWQILFILLAYLFGAIPWGFIFGKMHGIDLREHGSKNIGATNAGRVLGKRYAVLVYILDAFKGALFVALFRYGVLPHEWCVLSPMFYGFLAVLGHTFPIYLKFKGGKAVSCGSGAAGAYCIWILLIALLTFFIVTKISKFVSLGSICAAIATLISTFTFSLVSGDFMSSLFTTPETKFWPLNLWYTVFTVLIIVIVLIRHKSNIVRISKKEENKVSW